MKAQKDSVKAELRNNLLVSDRNRVRAQKSEIRVLDFATRNEFSAYLHGFLKPCFMSNVNVFKVKLIKHLVKTKQRKNSKKYVPTCPKIRFWVYDRSVTKIYNVLIFRVVQCFKFSFLSFKKATRI